MSVVLADTVGFVRHLPHQLVEQVHGLSGFFDVLILGVALAVAGLWLLTGYLTFGLGFLSPDNLVAQALIFGLALLSGCGFIGGLYLLVRVLV